MKKQTRHVCYSVAIGLIAVLTMVTAGCLSKMTYTTVSTASTSKLVLSSIGLEQISTNLEVGSTMKFIATGIYSDGSTADITSKVTWVNSAPTIVSIDSTGLATGEAVGNANITAVMSGITSPPEMVVVFNVTTPIPRPIPFSPTPLPNPHG